MDITALNYVPWDNGRTNPNNFGSNDLFTVNLNWQLPRGSRVNFAYTRNRNQAYGMGGFASLYNPDGPGGNLNTRDVFTLGWFQTLTQSADQQLATSLEQQLGRAEAICQTDPDQHRVEVTQTQREPIGRTETLSLLS